MKERLRSSDYRFLAVCLILLAATTWFSVHNFYRAFPEASIDFRVSRAEGRSVAQLFLDSQNYIVDGYRHASSFAFDDTAKTFLEREVGLDQANRIMGAKVRLWRWSYRWFRPQQKEEYRVDITTSGELVGFEHELPEDAPRADPGAAGGRALAENFLGTRMQRDLKSLEFVESSEVARAHRIDRVFTWKERDFDVKDATIRYEVTVLGSEVGGYREYLKVPDQWSRDYQRLRSKNEIASIADSAVTLVLFAGLLAVIANRVRRHDMRWRTAAIVGVIGMALAFCSQLNQLPLHEFEYPTTDSYTSFMTGQLLQAIVSALGAGGLLFVFTAGAEPLYREAYPGQISLSRLFGLRGLRTKRFFLGAVLGITLTGIFVAYQTGFYIVAYRFGAWSPADVPYSDLLNTRFPWLFVLFGGFLPAVSEEFLFRMFGIPYFKKLVRSIALALVLAGFIWGFGHSAYPQQPFYIRGVEVGIGGVALGIVMLRWGILPTLVWHYSVDAMYSAMLLLRSESLYLKLSGAASAGIIVLPVLVALVVYWRRGGFEPEVGLLNADESPPVEIPQEPVGAASASGKWPQLSRSARWAALGILLAGLLALRIPVQRFGSSPAYRIAEQQARAASDSFLRAQGLEPGAFEHVTYPAVHWGGNDSLAGKYFMERLPVPFAAAQFETHRPVQFWATRYFKSLDKEEALVTVHPETSKILGFHHTLPEDRPGADIAAEAARNVAARFAGGMGYDTNAMELKETRSEKMKARRDYTIVWEAPPDDARNLDETRFRVEAEVGGNRAVSLRSYWKVPEAYTRARSEQNLISIAVFALRIGVLAAGIVCGLWLLVHNIRKGLVRWGAAVKIAVPAALLTAVGPLLSRHLLLQGYQTAIPLETYQAMTYMVVAISVVFAFIVLVAAVAFLTSFFPDALPALRAGNRRLLGVDAVFALIATVGLGLMLHQVSGFLMDRFHAQALFSLDTPEAIASAAPAVAAIAGAVRSVLTGAALLGVVALIAARLPRRWMIWPLGLLAAFTMMPSGVRTGGEFALHYVIALLFVAAAAVFLLWFARGNYLAYALVLWVMALREPMSELLATGNRVLQINGWAVAGAMVAAVVWAVWPAITLRKQDASA